VRALPSYQAAPVGPYAGAAGARSQAISDRISRNICFGTAHPSLFS
jgi:hypothetical protein